MLSVYAFGKALRCLQRQLFLRTFRYCDAVHAYLRIAILV